MRKKVNFILCFILVAISTAYFSTGFTMPDDQYIYNGFSNEWVMDNENYIFLKGGNSKVINKKTNREFDFVLDAYDQNRISPSYCDDQNVFFLVHNDYGTQVGYQIKYYDKNFNTKRLFKEVFYKDQREELFGLIQSNILSAAETLENFAPSQFIVIGNKVYLYEIDGISQYDLRTRRKRRIYIGDLGSASFSYYDGKIYFLTGDFELYSYEVQSKQFNIIKDVNPYNFVVAESGIVYNDLNNSNRLSYYKFKNKERKCIFDGKAGGYDIEGDQLYFVTEKGRYYNYNLLTGVKTYLTTAQASQIIKKISGKNELYIALDGDDGMIKNEYVTFN